MKLKTVEVEGKTYAEIQDGKPVYIGDDGAEIAFDAPGTKSTIDRITEESKGYKTRAQAAEGKLKDFEGIEDPKAAKDALAKVKNWGDKELIEAGKVEEIKAAAIKAKDDEYKPIIEERDALSKRLNDELIGGNFARSKFAEEKVAVPRHMLRSTYGNNFKIEDGQVVPYDANGNKIYSRSKPGEIASFDEALEHLISADPYKDHILKGSGNAGSGANPGGGGGGDGAKTISREQFNSMGHQDRAATIKDGFKVVDE